MPTSTRHVTVRLITAMVFVVCAFPAAAQAASPALATITACKADNLTVAGKVKLTGKAARKARGAVLEIRFQALGLFGFPRSGQWRTVGKKTKASGQETIGSLVADNWIGVLSWRFKKGSRTVLSGDARSQPLKIGSSKGIANCIVSEGLKPADTTPPQIFILGVDDLWHKAPGQLQVYAQDDFSGVKSVAYVVDGGPITVIPNGGIISIPSEGSHNIDIGATDVAGNTGTKSTTLKVDAAPPTQPTLSKPGSVTASKTPTFQWSASTDSGSGLKGYGLVILRSDGSVASFQALDPSTTSAASAVTLDDGQTYTAIVRAFDNSSPDAQTTDSPPLTFKVDTQPDLTAKPADGTVLSGSAKSGNFTLDADRPVDPKTVSVVLHNVDTNADIQATVGCTATPCTSIVVDPQPDPLPEGRYTLTASGLKSDEGTAFPAFVAKYSVPFADGDSQNVPASGACTVSATGMRTYNLSAAAPAAERVLITYSWSTQSVSSFTVSVYAGPTATGSPVATASNSNASPVTLDFTIPQGTSAITVKYDVNCSSTSGKLSVAGLTGYRAP